MIVEVSSVADDVVVLHADGATHRFDGLTPDTAYSFLGAEVRTLPRPPGQLLCTFATVNDVHFGEVECGRIDDHPMGPILRRADGDDPYPLVMNQGAATEIAAIAPDAVLVKGDLTSDGTPEEFAAFEACWRPTFADRLHVIRGNHDAYRGQTDYAGDHVVDLPGVRLVLLDTAIPGKATGTLTADQVALLDTAAAEADRPVLAFGHHQNWVPGAKRDPDYFGLHPDASDALIDTIARRRNVLGYFAGHTHRNRVRHVERTDTAVFVEVGCVKDFPGSWAEYRVFEGGVLQVHHRISTPDALAWSEQCRWLYRDFGVDYQSYALGPAEHRSFAIPLRGVP